MASEAGAEAVAVTMVASEAKKKAATMLMVVSRTAAVTLPDSISGFKMDLYHRFINILDPPPTSIKTLSEDGKSLLLVL